MPIAVVEHYELIVLSFWSLFDLAWISFAPS